MVSSVKGSAFSFGANGVFNSVIDYGARPTKTAGQNDAIIASALASIAAAGGGVLVIPQGISHTFNPDTGFPVTANYLQVLEWTGRYFRVYCNQVGSYEFEGNTLVDGDLQVSGVSKLYGQIALSKTLLAPTTGQSIQITDTTARLVLYPAGTLATLTIVMPQNPVEGTEVSIFSSQILTALTLSPAAGQTIAGAITTLAANGSAAYIYNNVEAKWYRNR